MVRYIQGLALLMHSCPMGQQKSFILTSRIYECKMYDRQTYFRDTVADDIEGMVVIDTDESVGYRITEKRDGEWCKPFWMSEAEFQSLQPNRVGQLSSEAYLKLCRVVGIAE